MRAYSSVHVCDREAPRAFMFQSSQATFSRQLERPVIARAPSLGV